MDEKVCVRIRASQVPRWLKCPRRADWENSRKGREAKPKAEPVAITVGNLVHERVTGQPAEMPKLIEYDRHTQTEREMMRQVAHMHDQVLQTLEEWEAEIIEAEEPYEAAIETEDMRVEVAGRTDLKLLFPEHRHAGDC